jgi:hypothetical protein
MDGKVETKQVAETSAKSPSSVSAPPNSIFAQVPLTSNTPPSHVAPTTTTIAHQGATQSTPSPPSSSSSTGNLGNSMPPGTNAYTLFRKELGKN